VHIVTKLCELNSIALQLDFYMSISALFFAVLVLPIGACKKAATTDQYSED